MTRFVQAISIGFLLAATSLSAESKNLADYPLRVHIFARDQTTFYHWREAEESKGDGRANLFADGDVRGVDFNFDCSEKLRSSFGYETYPAKWKKPQQELTVLLPEFGKTGSYFTCNLKTDVKNFAYTRHNGSMGSESSADYKAWMMKHQYDPEHGQNDPINLRSQDAQNAAAPPAANAPPQPPAPPQ